MSTTVTETVSFVPVSDDKDDVSDDILCVVLSITELRSCVGEVGGWWLLVSVNISLQNRTFNIKKIILILVIEKYW